VEGSLVAEARSLLRSARALLEELAEEGALGAAPPPPAPAPAALAPTRPASEAAPARPRPASGVRGAPPQLALLDESPWGPHPSLEAVRAELGECIRCRLSEGRTQIVFGDGNPNAELMFVGEGPGESEDRRGLPFVGRAGELLTQMIEKGLGIPRSEVYICNVVKCRPPGNRTPLADEVAACSPFLDGQVAAVQPRVIVALGKPAASLLLGRDVPITRVRGTWFEYKGIPLMPTFHPAYVLRQYTPENRRRVWEDLKAALARARAGNAPR
jgi:uracil-DNA glycosylase family 4